MNLLILISMLMTAGVMGWLLWRTLNSTKWQETTDYHALKYVGIGLLVTATSYLFFVFGGK